MFFKKYYTASSIKWLYGSLLVLLFNSCEVKKHNRLSTATSPYLQEHADNPVDWYEWGDEALAAARKENKPLLISIGYAACHWCHQMETESFMDTAVARLMNENFICIKVDREERPDIDNIYMSACNLISGNAGWPLNAFALPDGKPFYAGTYYSKQSWMSLLGQISNAYQTKNNKVVLQAQALSHGIAQLEISVLTDSSVNEISNNTYQHLFEKVYQKMDLAMGGFKGAPKFPAPSAIEFLLQYYFLTKDKRALDAASTTLTKMALGGIYDHVQGGFARYSTDSIWKVPHFEKMLYDNAQLLSVYAHAYQLTHNEFFKQIMQEITTFIQAELSNGDNGYFCSVNADSDGDEGAFYSWTANELKTELKDNFQQVAGYYNISEKGNWKPGHNLLYATSTPLQYANDVKIDAAAFSKQLATTKNILLTERNKREKPTVDHKVLLSWNALLLKGFCDAFAATGDQPFLQYALSIAHFTETMMDSNGRLWRNYNKGTRTVNAFLDDYAFLGSAYIRLYELTFNKHWLLCSQQLTGYAISNFYNEATGMFYYTAAQSDSNLIRKIEITDNTIPSSNAVMASLLYKLGIYFDNQDYQDKAKHMLSGMFKQLTDGQTNFYASWCQLAGLFSYGTNEVAIMGPSAVAKSLVLQKNYLPASIFMGSVSDENLPLLQAKKPTVQTVIYVCTNGACKRPVEEIGEALQQLMSR